MLAGGFGRSGPISTPLCLLLRLLLRNDSFLDLSSRRHLYITVGAAHTQCSAHFRSFPSLIYPNVDPSSIFHGLQALDLLTDLSSHMFIAPLLTRPVDELEDDEAKSLDQVFTQTK